MSRPGAERALVYNAQGVEVPLIGVRKVEWSALDDRAEIEGMVVAGRLALEPRSGGRIDALKLARPISISTGDINIVNSRNVAVMTGAADTDDWRAWAVYWCRFLRAMRVVEVER